MYSLIRYPALMDPAAFLAGVFLILAATLWYGRHLSEIVLTWRIAKSITAAGWCLVLFVCIFCAGVGIALGTGWYIFLFGE